MPRKKKYENAEIAKQIMSREFNALGDTKSSVMFRFLDLKKKEDREYLKEQCEFMRDLFGNAVKELEE